MLNSVFLWVSSEVSERLRETTILRQTSLPTLCKVLILITWTILVLIVPMLLPFALILLSLYPVYRWISILMAEDVNTGDMKVPTFYASGLFSDPYLYCIFITCT